MTENIKSLNKRLKELGNTTEKITRCKGRYYLLHIRGNNMPVPLYYCKSAFYMRNHIEVHYNPNE